MDAELVGMEHPFVLLVRGFVGVHVVSQLGHRGDGVARGAC